MSGDEQRIMKILEGESLSVMTLSQNAVGDGHCVASVRAASGAPHSSRWMRGEAAKSADSLASGTVIATFDPDGKYGSRKDENSHTAILSKSTAVGSLCSINGLGTTSASLCPWGAIKAIQCE